MQSFLLHRNRHMLADLRRKAIPLRRTRMLLPLLHTKRLRMILSSACALIDGRTSSSRNAPRSSLCRSASKAGQRSNTFAKYWVFFVVFFLNHRRSSAFAINFVAYLFGSADRICNGEDVKHDHPGLRCVTFQADSNNK